MLGTLWRHMCSELKISWGPAGRDTCGLVPWPCRFLTGRPEAVTFPLCTSVSTAVTWGGLHVVKVRSMSGGGGGGACSLKGLKAENEGGVGETGDQREGQRLYGHAGL